MLFYVPAPVYVVVSARLIRMFGIILCPETLVYVVVSVNDSHTLVECRKYWEDDRGVCTVRLFNMSTALR